MHPTRIALAAVLLIVSETVGVGVSAHLPPPWKLIFGPAMIDSNNTSSINSSITSAATATTPTIVIIATTWGAEPIVRLEARSLVLTIMRWEHGPLHLIFVCENEEKRLISAWFATCHRSSPLVVEFVHWDRRLVKSGVTGLGLQDGVRGPVDHHSGIAGAMKMFLPEILAHHNKVRSARMHVLGCALCTSGGGDAAAFSSRRSVRRSCFGTRM